MSKLQRLTLNPSQAPKPIGAYSMVSRVKMSEMVFVAGQVPLDNEGNLVGMGDPGAQVSQVYRNIGLVLEGVGASFENIVEMTTCLTSAEFIKPFYNARQEFFKKVYPNGDFPPNTIMVINELVRKEFLVEISAIAALP